ncbi:GntR family transcriptional regulator [Luteococcus peritonei]|uniref:GntR family transcriptional regulator n=1 Tax=Luteococcus peritonei TaxID=88874 RepID=A0ABW4RTK1_9ACTN
MPTSLPVVVDRTSPVPLYHQLAEQWAAAIRSGTLKPGDPFENELALVARLRLSRPTVRKAMDELVRQGLLVRRRGVGTHVASTVVHRREAFVPLFEELRSSGRQPRTEVLRLQAARPNPVAARALGLARETSLTYLERLRFAEGRPLVVLRSWLPPRFNDVTATDFDEHGLYEVLGWRGVEQAVARQRVAARLPTGRERRLLELPRHAAVLAVTWLSHDAEGQALEYGEHTYRGDSQVLDNTLHRGASL